MSESMKPYPNYKDSALKWLGKIPSHWAEKRAKYFLREVDERSTTGEEQLMSVSHKTGVTPRKSNVTMFKAESNIGHKICRVDDLAINTLWAWMSALGVSRYTGLISPAYGVYRQVNKDNFDSEYLDYLLRTPAYATEYRCKSTGITSSRLRLYPIDFLRIPLIQPPRDEQEKIVRYLKHQDALIRQFIRNRRRLIEVLTEQKQAIINRAVTRGLDPSVKLKPSGVDWLGDVPEHWLQTRLKRVAKLNPVKSEIGPARESDDGVVFLPMEKVSTSGEVDYSLRRPVEEVWNNFTYFRRNDVVVAKITPCFENGKGACLSEMPTDFGFGTTEFIVLRSTDEILPNYLYAITSTSEFRRLGKESMTGAAGQQRISPDFVANFPIILPPKTEQTQILQFIGSELSDFDKGIEIAASEIKFITSYRQRLIADVVTGRIDASKTETFAQSEETQVGLDCLHDNITDEPELDEELAHADD